MQNDRTFQPEPPEFTVRHMVFLMCVVCTFIGIITWLTVGDPATGLSISYIAMLYFLKYRKHATSRAIIIATEPVAGIFGFFWACGAAYGGITGQNHFVYGLPNGVIIIWGSVVALGAFHWLWESVKELPKQWDTPVRQIYPK
jgi:4-hydroxybenzoate polyprenyltransferase